MEKELLPLPLEIKEETIIKVVGVGGGGCNAVNNMQRQGIKDVSFLVCTGMGRFNACTAATSALRLSLGSV